jgi:hypothetical protein
MAIPPQAAPPACGDIITTDTTFSADLLNCPTGVGLLGLDIGEDNITLDCDGHKVTGTGSGGGVGIRVLFRSGVTVRNCDVSGFSAGIILWGTRGTTVG